VEGSPEIAIIVKEVVDSYNTYVNTKSKVRRSEEGKRLDRSIKKLKKYLDRDDSIHFT
jgi:hypothetical protein